MDRNYSRMRFAFIKVLVKVIEPDNAMNMAMAESSCIEDVMRGRSFADLFTVSLCAEV